MPTGYTSDIYNGKNVTFEKFVFACSRAFMPSMRDSAFDAPIPDKYPVSDYHKKELDKAKKNVVKYAKMTIAQAAETLKKNEIKVRAEEKKSKEESEALRLRYEAMVIKVERWSVPKELAGLKKFMLEQLRESIKFDCSVLERQEKEEPMTPEEYLQELRESAEDDVKYHSAGLAKDISIAKSNETWIKMLKKSVRGKK